MNAITSADVAAYLTSILQPLADKTTEYINLRADVTRYTDGEFRAVFTAYIAGPGHTTQHPTAEGAVAEALTRVEDPAARARRLRDDAAKLLALAEKSEALAESGFVYGTTAEPERDPVPGFTYHGQGQYSASEQAARPQPSAVQLTGLAWDNRNETQD